jgi:hypothetical protein
MKGIYLAKFTNFCKVVLAVLPYMSLAAFDRLSGHAGPQTHDKEDPETETAFA